MSELEAAWARGELEQAPRAVALAHRGQLDLAGPFEQPLVHPLTVRSAFLRFEAPALRALAAVGEPSWRAVALALADALRGAPPAPDIVVPHPVAAALLGVGRALAALAAGALGEGTEHARAAVRAAVHARHRDAHAVALLALARARRVAGRPHLCRHVCTGLDLAPEVYHPWRALERFLAGDPAALRSAPVAEALDAADPGPRLAPWAGSFEDAGRELGELAAALQGAPSSAFVRGRTHSLWHRVEVAFSTHAPLAAVFVEPQQRGLRRLHPRVVPSLGAPAGGRTEDAIAALALAGPEGVPVPALFRDVYGFAYKTSVHDGAFRVLLTRIRQTLGDAATLTRLEDQLALRVHRPFVVADARVRSVYESPVIGALVEGAGASARDLAERLRLPLRTVQAELQKLVEEGICVRQRAGREAAYEIEDTTFRTSPG